jgi:hypothetical protein
MTFDFVARGLVQALSALAVVSLVASLAVAWWWRRQATTVEHPIRLARRLFAMRALPGSAAVVIAFLAVPVSYWLWEPRAGSESVGALALLLAGIGAAILASSAIRLAGAVWQSRAVTRRLVEATEGSVDGLDMPAARIESTFPVVALVGVLQPRLFVAAGVLQACTRDELRTVIAHELAHARTRDNLRRLLLVAVPDPLSWLPIGGRMHRDWGAAAERAADEAAVASDPRDRVHLAEALVKVARLAEASRPVPLPASALYRGEAVADRVRRLVSPPDSATTGSRQAWWLHAALAGLLATAPLGLRLLHDALEALIAIGR